jgi:hypothetical protein
MSKPKLIISAIRDPKVSYTTVESETVSYRATKSVKTKEIHNVQISTAITIDAYGDFSEYWNGSVLDTTGLMMDVLKGKIKIKN